MPNLIPYDGGYPAVVSQNGHQPNCLTLIGATATMRMCQTCYQHVKSVHKRELEMHINAVIKIDGNNNPTHIWIVNQ